MRNETPTHEENVLYLLVELDEALKRRTPRLTPEQVKIVRRRVMSLSVKLVQLVQQ